MKDAYNRATGLENQRIEGHAWLGESGLWYVPVEHQGNQNASPEEVEIVADLVNSLTQPAVRWIDDKGNSRTIAAKRHPGGRALQHPGF